MTVKELIALLEMIGDDNSTVNIKIDGYELEAVHVSLDRKYNEVIISSEVEK